MDSESAIAILAYAEKSWISYLLICDNRLTGLDIENRKSVRPTYDRRKGRLRRLRLDSYVFCALVNELRYSPAFRSSFIGKWRPEVVSSEIESIFVRVTNPAQYPLDYKWNYKVEAIVNRHLELEKLMWLLSTLGGAFSALGDIATEYAHRAGRISWEQLKIAFLLADPITVSRCKLFVAISYIQTGRLRLAKCIIRQQYRFATSSSVADNRQLRNACVGVWSKLQYAYQLKRLGKSMTDRTS